jgi:flagellar biosynthetic protein FliR
VTQTVAFVLTGMLVLGRITGLMMFLPGLSARGIPRQVTILLSVAISLLIATSIPRVPVAEKLGIFMLGMGAEILLGVLLGLSVRAIFSSVASAADLAASQMGMGQASMSDPFLRGQESALAVLAAWIAAVVFFLTGMHLRCLEAVAWSFDVIPPGQVGLPTGMAPTFVTAVTSSFTFAIQLAGPILAMEWLTNLFIAILSKIAPKMNAFFAIGTTVNSISAVAMFLVSLPWIVSVHSDALIDAVENLQRLIREAR